MADIHIYVDFRIFPKLPWALVTLLLTLCAPELGSENVTLTTYYPPPAGVYSKLVSTYNAFLARDGGNVGIGTTAPGRKLDVNGGFRSTRFYIGADYFESAAGDDVSFYSNSLKRMGVNNAGKVGFASSDLTPGANFLAYVGDGDTGGMIRAGQTGCMAVQYTNGLTSTCSQAAPPGSCPLTGGKETCYVTNQSGVWSEFATTSTPTVNGTVSTMICCPCLNSGNGATACP